MKQWFRMTILMKKSFLGSVKEAIFGAVSVETGFCVQKIEKNPCWGVNIFSWNHVLLGNEKIDNFC
jgi:hypothetical protein